MTKDDGSVRADAIDLNIGGNRVRVVCEDPGAMVKLRSALEDHVEAEPAPVGFMLRPPSTDNGMYMLLDRSGFVLARTRNSDQALAALGSHLGGLLPAPEDTVRLRCRALLGDDSSAVLVAFPFFVDPPLVERRLEHASYRMIDRLAVDIAPGGMLSLSPSPWSELGALETATGHTSPPSGTAPLRAMVVPHRGSESPSPAQVVAFLAAAASPRRDRATRLDMAELLAAGPVVAVDPQESGGIYRVLKTLR